MIPQYGVVILNKYPELASALLLSIQRTHKEIPQVVVVCDNHKTQFNGFGTISTSHPFIYAKNANIGIEAMGQSDVILCNDDMECVDPDFFHRLASIAYKYPQCGIMSPLIDGGVGNPMQKFPPVNLWKEVPKDEVIIRGDRIDSYPVCFPCVFMSRRMLTDVGPLDEKFVGYGYDDNDYCLRARKKGYLTMVTKALRIQHGRGGPFLDRGYNWSLSFAREPEKPPNEPYFKQKYQVAS